MTRGQGLVIIGLGAGLGVVQWSITKNFAWAVVAAIMMTASLFGAVTLLLRYIRRLSKRERGA